MCHKTDINCHKCHILKMTGILIDDEKRLKKTGMVPRRYLNGRLANMIV